MTRYPGALLGATLAGCVLCGAALAEGFDARPVTIETHDGAGAVVVTNPGAQRIYLETQVYDWSQDAAGHDVLVESDAAVASPPALWVEPRSSYNLRLRLPPGPVGQERAYRVVIRQLPERSAIVAGHIIFALTESLPAFVEPDDMRPPALRAHLDGPRSIVVVNEGGRRARLSNLVQDGMVIAPGLAGYALPHSTVSIPLKAGAHPGPLELETDIGHRTIALQ